MALNPETNRFEQAFSKEATEALGRMERLASGLSDLVRADGSAIPAHWAVFRVGELVELKGHTFRVAYIGESAILFEPVKPGNALNNPQYTSGSDR